MKNRVAEEQCVPLVSPPQETFLLPEKRDEGLKTTRNLGGFLLTSLISE